MKLGRKPAVAAIEVRMAGRSLVETRRPVCPSCGTRCPHPEVRDSEWFFHYGHRDMSGNPCPGWGQKAGVYA